MWCRFLCLIAAGLASASAFAQVPAGPEFRVNIYTTAEQRSPSVAPLADGGFVAVWASRDQDGSFDGVFGQRFSANGTRTGDEFQVNSYTTGNQFLRLGLGSVSSDRAGNFVVVWTNYEGQDGNLTGVFGQRFDRDGGRRGAEFQVNSYFTGNQVGGRPSVAPDGRFVVVWIDYLQDGFSDGVFLRRYDAAGVALGAELRVNTYTTGRQIQPTLGSDAAGNFVVAWASPQDGYEYGIMAQRFDASGNRRGGEFQVNTYTTHLQLEPSLAVHADGSFVVAWHSTTGTDGPGLFARRFDAAGAALGVEFRVNVNSLDSPSYPRVAADGLQAFVVSWSSGLGDGSGAGVSARRFTALGAPIGSEFRVNAYTTDTQAWPAIALDGSGNFVIAWESAVQDSGTSGIYAQRWGGLLPVAFTADGAGNGVLEAGETAVIAPSWRNVGAAPLAFGGTASAFTGPAGPTYTLLDGAADYGTLPAGATGSCGADCYAVSVVGTRPSQHWDASLLETITPGVLGQTRQRTLHLGDSFTDVPRSNPFYRFIEALLHHGVTGGCTAASYCPSTATSRAAMAVFVLVAKDGAGRVPPACSPPNLFADVPETSPFCRWIEELANRAVVSGCGGGNYCPTAAVTRDQMAIFVLRTLDPVTTPPACAPPNLFADVPETSPYCRWIEELARRGIVTGCGGGNYCPDLPVTREQMGVFIGLTFGLAIYGP